MAGETTTIGIEVTADTAAARRAFDDLTDAIREKTTAAKADGEEQKTLAKRTAEAKEAQIATTEAVNRAKAALSEHNETVKAHGKDSKEAAESLAKLKAASAEAAKAAAVSEKALAGVAAETAKAVKESDKLTPALRRAANEVKQVGTQAERSASEVRKLGSAIATAEKATETWDFSLSSFVGNLGANFISMIGGKFVDTIRWAAEHNEKFGSSFKQAEDAATSFAESIVNGPLGNAMISVTDWSTDAFHAVKRLGDEMKFAPSTLDTASERLEAYARANKGALGQLGDMVKETFVFGQAQRDLNDAIKEGERAKYAAARIDAMVAAANKRSQTETNDARAADRLARQRNADLAKAAANRKPAEDLSASPVSRGFADIGSSDSLAVQIEQNAFERESAIREARLKGLDQEILEMEARDQAKAASMSDQAQWLSDEIDMARKGADATVTASERRLQAEIKLAEWQEQNAIESSAREAARIRREDAMGKLSVMQIQRHAEAEANIMEGRATIMRNVAGHVGDAFGSMAEAAMDHAATEEKAALKALYGWAKSVRNQMLLMAIKEAALGVASAAGIFTAAAAPGHFAAAATAGAAAAAAAALVGVIGMAEGVGGSSSQSVQAAHENPSSSSPSGGGGGSSSSETTSPRNGEGLEQQSVPVSHEQLMRATGPRITQWSGSSDKPAVHVTIGTVVGPGGIREAANEIRKELERQDRGGRRERL